MTQRRQASRTHRESKAGSPSDILWYVEQTVRQAGETRPSTAHRLPEIHFSQEDALIAAEEYAQQLASSRGLQMQRLGKSDTWHIWESGGEHRWITTAWVFDLTRSREVK